VYAMHHTILAMAISCKGQPLPMFALQGEDERDVERRQRRADAIDDELRDLLDNDGDVTQFYG